MDHGDGGGLGRSVDFPDVTDHNLILGSVGNHIDGQRGSIGGHCILVAAVGIDGSSGEYVKLGGIEGFYEAAIGYGFVGVNVIGVVVVVDGDGSSLGGGIDGPQVVDGDNVLRSISIDSDGQCGGIGSHFVHVAVVGGNGGSSEGIVLECIVGTGGGTVGNSFAGVDVIGGVVVDHGDVGLYGSRGGVDLADVVDVDGVAFCNYGDSQIGSIGGHAVIIAVVGGDGGCGEGFTFGCFVRIGGGAVQRGAVGVNIVGVVVVVNDDIGFHGYGGGIDGSQIVDGDNVLRSVGNHIDGQIGSIGGHGVLVTVVRGNGSCGEAAAFQCIEGTGGSAVLNSLVGVGIVGVVVVVDGSSAEHNDFTGVLLQGLDGDGNNCVVILIEVGVVHTADGGFLNLQIVDGVAFGDGDVIGQVSGAGIGCAVDTQGLNVPGEDAAVDGGACFIVGAQIINVAGLTCAGGDLYTLQVYDVELVPIGIVVAAGMEAAAPPPVAGACCHCGHCHLYQTQSQCQGDCQ